MSCLDSLFGRRNPVRDLERDINRLVKLVKESRNIMATQKELADEVIAKTTQIRKAINEITTKLEALEDAIKNAPVTQELRDAVTALGVAVQAADDIVPDQAPPAGNG